MLIAGFNFFIGMFNFVPLLPLDGGHIAGALYEALRRGVRPAAPAPRPRVRRRRQAAADRLRRGPRSCSVMGVVLIVADIVVPGTSSPDPREAVGRPERPTSAVGHDLHRPGHARPRRRCWLPAARPARSRSARSGSAATPDLGPVDDDDADLRRQRHPPADRRAHRHRLRHRAGRLPEPGRRRRARRRSPSTPRSRSSPTSTSSRSTSSPRSTPAAPPCGSTPATSASSTTRSRRSPAPPRTAAPRSGSASTPARSTSGCWRSTARPRPRRSSSPRCGRRPLRGARLPRLQDLGQAQRPGRDGARLRAARRGRRLAAAPRRHRGRPGLPGHHQVRGRLRRAALAGHRRHDPGLAVRAAGRGGQGRPPDPGVAQPAPRQLEIVSCPSCGRAQVDVYKLAEEVTAGLEGWRSRCASPSWAASSTAPARRARPTSASPPATARARSSSRARSSRPCPSRRSSRP